MKSFYFVFIGFILLISFSLPEYARGRELGVININQASLKTLTQLPGVGPLTAAAIIEKRRKRPFTSIVQLRRVRGIGRRKYRRLRSLIAVSGPTTFSLSQNTKPEACESSPK